MDVQQRLDALREHHRNAVIHLAERVRNDPDFLAVVIIGSVAKGIAREDSDIDCYIVAKDEVFAERRERDDLFFNEREGCNYPGGYYDGKIVNYDFIKAAAEKGSEPTRASFEGGFVPFTRISGLGELVDTIAVYPEHQRERNFADFYAQVALYGGYFAKRALALDNTYLLMHSVSQVALFAGRLILAYNRILFPCHKSLKHALEKAPAKPDDYMKLHDEMLMNPTKETIDAFMKCIRTFHDWGIDSKKTVSRFVENNEWNWLEGEPPLSDR
ncbi:nucleotidyltransferase domain-containing protein [Paenibacillus hamazuiensis]|uniref:nucleotidyltransferase domain-containing protein n=1 Tax=Paenibacillus hamazuiensis TaxID=2936508 RepID=UPI00200E4256|nr:nucleotidyltransferase domain-containing protein [Paenibacillus hamazuiensis]